MPGKASPLRAPPAGSFKGKFNIRKFDIANDADRKQYEALRTKNNEVDGAVQIEYMRDLTETSEVTDAEGNRVRNDTWYIVVQWWETEPSKAGKGENVFSLKTGESK